MIVSHAFNIATNILSFGNAIHYISRSKEEIDVRRGSLCLSAALGVVLCARAVFFGQITVPFKFIEFPCVVIDLLASAYFLKKDFTKKNSLSLQSSALCVARVGWELSKYSFALKDVDICHFDKVWMVLTGLEIVSRFYEIRQRET